MLINMYLCIDIVNVDLKDFSAFEDLYWTLIPILLRLFDGLYYYV